MRFRILALLTITVTASAQYFPPPAGLVGWWRGEGDANDSVGGHNGVLQGGMGFTNGMFGQAFEGGTNKRAYIPDNPAFQLSSFTIGAWVNIHANSYTAFCRTSSQLGPYALSANFDGNIHLVINGRGGTADDELAAPITYNRWHQVTATLNAALAKMSIYIDGSLVAQKTSSATPVLNLPASGDTGLGIGNDLNFDFPMLGEIDEVVLYSRALSPAEVTTLAAVGACQPHRASATAQVVNGFVVGATITDGGCGYAKPPLVLIQGGGGSGAMANATLTNGMVSEIVITDAGIGYTNTPTIYIYPPVTASAIGLVKAVKPSFRDLFIGTNYQLQVSADMNFWTNQGSPFAATNTTMVYPQYLDVETWGQLFFRLQSVP